MKKSLLIVFAKNIVLGKVKTRLAKDIGDNKAFEIYLRLVEITEQETLKLNDCDLHIYFSDVIINSLWPYEKKFVQSGEDLGQRMKKAFDNGFNDGYERIIGIGTDLPDIKAALIDEAFDALSENTCVFGPSEDGGYYLIGMSRMIPEIFENKKWSTDHLLEDTLSELNSLKLTTFKLKVLNDIDTIEDLRKSSLKDVLKKN